MTTETRPSSNYEAWHIDLTRWDSVSEFAANGPWADGVHTISLGDGPSLDLMIVGQPHTSGAVIPVFFNGAVSARETKTGPFFSGSRLATKGGFGFIAVSDPSLGLDPSVGLAWYAGNRYSDVQDQITAVLASIAARTERELLFIGGSGGGFASLYYGGKLSTVASAIVWNPQTEIQKYNPAFVENYMQHAWGGEENCTAQTSVVGSLPKRLVYMQNANDWHVSGHTQPFLEAGHFTHRGRGVFVKDSAVVCFASYGDGHAPLPEGPLTALIHQFLDPGTTASQAVDAMLARHATSWRTPEWSHPHLITVEQMEVPLIS
ncbi:hypothetical protein [Paenarthrobacter sp. NPDC091669]|uniref:hypothetical protein n=1 Tax=Paenarthrobacter sp. NPDC091669 TaxID=3364384 RepID=UPI0038150075